MVINLFLLKNNQGNQVEYLSVMHSLTDNARL